MKKFVWLGAGDSILFEASDAEEAYRKVLAARIDVHCLGCNNPSKEMIQLCVNWSAQEDTIVEVQPMKLDKVFEGEVPEASTGASV